MNSWSARATLLTEGRLRIRSRALYRVQERSANFFPSIHHAIDLLLLFRQQLSSCLPLRPGA